MITLRSRLSELVAADENRTLQQLGAFGVDAAEAPLRARIELAVPSNATPPQRLIARACLDYVLRLDPLVTHVSVTGFSQEELHDLEQRVPFEVVDAPSTRAAYSLAVGAGGNADLVVDGGGWFAGLGASVENGPEHDRNPIGALASAALAAGEVFKVLFRLNYPDAPYSRRFTEAAGAFSFFDYHYNGANPALDHVSLDALLVGLGGVGASIVRAIAELGPHVDGTLRLIDDDILTTHNLNRVTYARWAQAVAGEKKVDEASIYLATRAPRLEVTTHAMRFDAYKRGVARHRANRHYETIVTGLDDDDVRHEIQRDLPRVLIDGATGRDANLTVERSIVGEWGCLGCTRQFAPPGAGDLECDELPDERAPSISFLSGLAGTLAAGELLKEATQPTAALRGVFDLNCMYGPNPDQRREPAFSKVCRINCTNDAVLRAYRAKYPKV